MIKVQGERVAWVKTKPKSSVLNWENISTQTSLPEWKWNKSNKTNYSKWAVVLDLEKKQLCNAMSMQKGRKWVYWTEGLPEYNYSPWTMTVIYYLEFNYIFQTDKSFKLRPSQMNANNGHLKTALYVKWGDNWAIF